MPKREHRPGTQSAKVTWTGTGYSGSLYGECACAERMAASKKVQSPSENWGIEREDR